MADNLFINVMKKIILTGLILVMWLSLPVKAEDPAKRGLFVSMLQESAVLSSHEEISKLIEYAKKHQIQTLFVQIYRANKARFPSELADDAAYQEILKNTGEDPFALLIREAHAEKIEVHAWLNLLSLSANTDAMILKKFGTEILTRNQDPKEKLEDFKVDNQYFLEPGDPRVRDYLSEIIKEIVTTYPDLDGVQFDYIRYPDWHPFYGHTEANIAQYKEATDETEVIEDSNLWKGWKRKQVTTLLTQLIRTAREIRPDIQVSTTGLMLYSRAFHEGSQDWKMWISSGLVDFVTLMCYTVSAETFKRYLADAQAQVSDYQKINIAVGAYRLSQEDFDGQFRLCEESKPKSCVIFYYGSLGQPD